MAVLVWLHLRGSSGYGQCVARCPQQDTVLVWLHSRGNGTGSVSHDVLSKIQVSKSDIWQSLSGYISVAVVATGSVSHDVLSKIQVSVI
ncbi:hypothetical protein PR048_027061 [Dryococelus australis]|uniref:Uncharacterized protein n=1 Tax=Dryococelus australis TaxID=614101 RepID=A0ABQ9GG43_9NEOP|nr:hypothetical protein PR048_027061 [Dryococelus australis]